MTKLVIIRQFEEEIDLLQDEQPNLSGAAWLLLTALYENKDLLDRLHVPTAYPLHTPVFEVKLFQEAQQSGYNIYILKFQDLEGYLANHRIFLGFNAQRDTYYVLALTHRSFAYDAADAAFGELLRRYDECAIPKFA